MKESKNNLIENLKKRYLNKHIARLEKKYGISRGSSFRDDGITWCYYIINNYSIVITLKYNTIISIDDAY